LYGCGTLLAHKHYIFGYARKDCLSRAYELAGNETARIEKMKISIVIRSYNEEENVGRLLSGIAEQTISDLDIIVVDSGSTDATVSIASRYPVRILTIPKEDFSFGRSLNIGCKAAKGDLIVLASAHVYPVYKDWLEKLIRPFDDPNVALVYGKQRGGKMTKYSENQIFKRWFPEDSNARQSHPFCNNANAVMRKSLWQQMLYNEMLTGLEDLDWAQRAVGMGYRIAYSHEAEVIHVHNERLLNIYNRYRREAIALKTIYPHEWFNLWDFLRLLIANVLSDYYAAIIDGLFWQNIVSIFGFRLMQFWGTYRGYIQRTGISSQLRQKLYYPANINKGSRDKLPEDERRIEYGSIPAEPQAAKERECQQEVTVGAKL
jgi:rhamnosyltransferase